MEFAAFASKADTFTIAITAAVDFKGSHMLKPFTFSHQELISPSSFRHPLLESHF